MCVESAISQTYSNIEIILVDDGSPDKCGDICDYYQARDPRIKVIHQANAGLSAARNAGMAAASGDFVFHLDGDDHLPQNAIKALVTKQRCGDYDMVFGNFEIIDDADNHKMIERDYHDDKSAFLESIVSDLGFHHYVWGILIRKGLYDINGIQPTEGVNVGEDLQVLPQLLSYCGSYTKISSTVYCYNRYNSNSLTFQKSNSRLAQDIRSICILEGFLLRNGLNGLYERLVKTELNIVVGNIYMRCILCGAPEEYQQLVRYSRRLKFRNAFDQLPCISKVAVKLNNFSLAKTWLSVVNILLRVKNKLR